jgi:2-polyprenyl-6-methoxyphenol hydroxylase-like FAD-dependent oxidoreductase
MKVLISGASIAGPVLAYWLNRYGFEVTVVERAPHLRKTGGHAVDLFRPGMDISERMGVLPRIEAKATGTTRMTAYREGKRTPVTVDLTKIFSAVSDRHVEVMRDDLSEIYYDATKDVEYLFGDSITRIDDDRVEFEHHAPRRFDIVVGADGLHSGVRALAFGPEERFVRPLGCVMAFFTAPDRYGLDDGWMRMYNAPGTMLALRPDRVPGRVKALMAFRTPPAGVHRQDTAAQRALLTRTFAGTGWVADQVLADLAASTDLVVEEIGQTRMDSWSSGRVVLLGDAAWCPSPLAGLGTSTALVGAYVLAGELARAVSDHSRAFAAYEDVMRPYIAQAQELPPGGVNGFVPKTRLAIALRTHMIRLMNRRPLRNIMAAQFGKADAIELPDYERTVAAA